jgi:hypothetical protein
LAMGGWFCRAGMGIGGFATGGGGS